MRKRFMQAFLLFAVLVVGASVVGASSLEAKFYDDQGLTTESVYMGYYVESTSVETTSDGYLVTVDFADAYASIITGFSVDGATVTQTSPGVYQYTLTETELTKVSKGSISYVRPTNNETYNYGFFVTYQ